MAAGHRRSYRPGTRRIRRHLLRFQPIGRISADGKTLPPYDKDTDGKAFIGPNDFAPDKKGGIYFTGSGKGGPLIDASAYYIGPDGKVKGRGRPAQRQRPCSSRTTARPLSDRDRGQPPHRIRRPEMTHSLANRRVFLRSTISSRRSPIFGRTASRSIPKARCISARAPLSRCTGQDHRRRQRRQAVADHLGAVAVDAQFRLRPGREDALRHGA